MTRMTALVLLSVVAGCGGPGGIGLPGGNVPREQYTSEAYKAICSHYAACGIAKSAQTCNEYYQTLLGAYATVGTTFYDKAIELGKIKYDGAAAARCLSGYANSACSLSALLTPASDCYSVYVGQVPVGSACGFGQCVPSAYCSSDVDAKCPGTCKARVEAGGVATSAAECVRGLVVISGTCSQPPGEGSSCSVTTAPYVPCAAGLTCATDTKTCVKPKLEGDACTSTSPCDTFYRCVNGKCAPPGDVGASCGQATGSGLGCKIELYCKFSGSTGACAERLSEGAVCTGSDCNFNLRCSKVTANATDKTCHPPTKLNGACTAATGTDCDSGLYCSTSSLTCVAQLTAGASCTTTDVCSLGTCSAGKCVSYVDLSSICI